ncbi:HD domain-containing phosphohydrolase [Bacillus sp. Marseille-P3661]
MMLLMVGKMFLFYSTGRTNIPFYARIMAVADTFDAMTSQRIYRNTTNME